MYVRRNSARQLLLNGANVHASSNDDSPTSALAQFFFGSGLTFKNAADLARLLPTGTVLAFQVLSPLFTNVGHCAIVDGVMTACLLLVCGLSCVAVSFTDSVKVNDGTVRYGLATWSGIMMIDGQGPLPPDVDPARYRISAIDYVHAFTALVVFLAVALFDNNVVSCFFPLESSDARRVMASLPVGLGVAGSLLFMTFPSTRHGIGFPVAPTNQQ